MSFSIRQLISKYSLVVLVPTFVVAAIYTDYSHTQEWKQKQAD